jgi:hypothetical protein
LALLPLAIFERGELSVIQTGRDERLGDALDRLLAALGDLADGTGDEPP